MESPTCGPTPGGPTSPNAFDDHSRDLASTFAAYAGVALANMHLYEAQARVAEQLQAAMQSRSVIEQQTSNRKLREVAEVLVAEVGDAR